MRKVLSVVLAVLCLAAAATGCGSGEMKKPAFVKVGTNGSRTDDPVGFQFEPPQAGEEIAVLTTNMGVIRIRLFADSAPIAVANFKGLIQKGYYDGLTFHRVVEDFMIQSGDPNGDSTGGKSLWGDGFQYEFNDNLRHFRGALSMAHSSLPDSNGSQFFIVQNSGVTQAELQSSGYYDYIEPSVRELYYEHGGTYFLDGHVKQDGHTVFGQVFEGMDVVDAIAALPVDEDDKPLQKVTVEKAELVAYLP